MVGYVNFIDVSFNPEDPKNDSGTGQQEWGDYGMDIPENVFYTNGHSSNTESKEMFLSSPDRNVERTSSVIELEYIERQNMENLALSNVPGST